MTPLDPTDPEVWRLVRAAVHNGLGSSLHTAIATTSPDGRAHVSPIGSLSLRGPGEGRYLELFNVGLARNLDHDPRFTLLTVDSRLRAWGRALLAGQFTEPPAVRLQGVASPARPATEGDLANFQRRVRPLMWTRGAKALWGRTDGTRVRDLTFTGVVPVRFGTVTRGLWPADLPRAEVAG